MPVAIIYCTVKTSMSKIRISNPSLPLLKATKNDPLFKRAVMHFFSSSSGNFPFKYDLHCPSFDRTNFRPSNNFIAHKIVSEISYIGSYVVSKHPSDFSKPKSNWRLTKIFHAFTMAISISNFLKPISSEVEIEDKLTTYLTRYLSERVESGQM